MKTITHHGILLAAGAITLLAPSPARALSCGFAPPQFPIDGTVAVPTDTLLWGYSFSEGGVTRLMGPAGEVAIEEQEVDVEPLPRLRLSALVPRVELEADTAYTIEIASYSVTERVTFITGSGPAGDAPPPLPALIASEASTGAGYYGDPIRWVTFEFAPHAGILIGRGREAQSNREAWWLSGSNELWMGISDCPSWPEGAGDRLDGQFGVLDGVGNFSGWVEMPVEIPSDAEAVAALMAQRAADTAATATDDQVVHRVHRADCSLARGGSRGGGWASLGLGGAAAAVLRARAKRR